MMENKEIFILGVGHNTIVYIDLVETCGYKVGGLYHFNDERTGEYIHGYPVIDSNINLFKKESLQGLNFAISVGNNKIRSELANKIRKLGGNLPTLIHPSAIVSKYSQLAKGVVIHANSVIQADAMIEQDTIISYNSSVTHTTKIGKSCYLAFGSTVGAYVEIQDNVFVGQSAAIVSGKLNYVGHDSIVGAGSVVIQNIEPFSVVAGNPAKLIKKTF
jgi:sugar O-acyltransferase (sialic acid O-acetyltransferase NeuD family)